MGAIAGLSCIFGMPENDEREQSISLGQATDGSWKKVKHDDSKKILDIPLHGLSTTDKTALENIVEASSNPEIKIKPDSHIDMGAGSGALVRAHILDNTLDFQKSNHEKWDGSLSFAFEGGVYKLKIDSIHFMKIDATNILEIQ